MSLMDILNWISRNGLAAFFIGCFIITGVSWLCHLVINAIRAFTGKYPPPRPVVECPCHDEEEEEDESTY